MVPVVVKMVPGSITINVLMIPKTKTFVVLTMVFCVEKMFSIPNHLFSETETMFYGSERIFSITEKIVGEVPAMFVHPQIGFSGEQYDFA